MPVKMVVFSVQFLFEVCIAFDIGSRMNISRTSLISWLHRGVLRFGGDTHPTDEHTQQPPAP